MSTNIEWLSKAKQIESQIINYRRRIHKYPELAFQEKNTAAFVKNELKDLGFEVTSKIGGTCKRSILLGEKRPLKMDVFYYNMVFL